MLHSSVPCCTCFMLFEESGSRGSDGDMAHVPKRDAVSQWPTDVARGALGTDDRGHDRAGRIEADGADCEQVLRRQR